jgi:hypothetical protein
MILGALPKLRKATISFVVFFCLPVRPCAWNNSAPTGRIFLEFYILVFFEKYVEKIKVSLISHKNVKHFTLAVNVLFWPHLTEFFLEWEIFRKKSCWEKLNTVLCPKNVVEPDRPQMTIRRMRIACWTSKATNAHSEYVMVIAFPLRQWLHEIASKLRYT